jgi:CDP-diacylglycerol--glycerol-3-phosphate 3-phosphatidyltransferase
MSQTNQLSSKQYNIPLVLTITRLLVSPLVLPIVFVYLLPYNSLVINSCLALIFVLIGLTDFFDGYLARRYNQETMLGRLLDPVADKCLVYATLIALVAAGKIFFYWAIIIIGREFLVMGLRLVAAEQNKSISVSFMGKVKTAVHMLCLTWLILNPYQSVGVWHVDAQHAQVVWWNQVEAVLLGLSVGISLLSGWVYYRRFAAQFAGPEKN